jgi:MFS family permease
MTDIATPQKIAQNTTFTVLFAISFCHLLNDMMQAVIPAIYPTLKAEFDLSFAQIGLITLAFQCTASLLQPAVGFFADIKPMPYSLAGGMVATLIGLLLLIFSKYFYLASISSYFTFYLIHTFGVSVQVAQVHLFLFLGAVAAGTFMGGPLGDKFGRKYVIWFSILGMLPFTLILPYANLFWTSVLSMIVGVIMASAFPAIVVYAQELLPGKVGMVSGLFYGFSFGMAGIGAAVLGELADATSITYVYKVCAFLPLIGLLTVFLPNFKTAKK